MVSLNPFQKSKLVVIKIGSSLLVRSDTGEMRQSWLDALCADIASLKQDGIQIVIVSSGAIALGRARLGLLGQSLSLPEKQACAAAGQSKLTQGYETALGIYKVKTAQVLFTLNDTENRRRWLNARSTLTTLLDMDVVPIINENDTVATDEIRYGDNDRLAARTAQMLGADTMILLSDINGLYSDNPRENTKARHIPIIETITPEILDMAGSANVIAGFGTGGMVTKLAAAQIAVQAGCSMCIMDGTELSPITRLSQGETCSWFKASANPLDARRQWISGALKPKGRLYIDGGAAKALLGDKSLLVAGVTRSEGRYDKGDAVSVYNDEGIEIARGLVTYDADAAQRILGLKGADIAKVLGYSNGPALIHRDNLVLVSAQ